MPDIPTCDLHVVSTQAFLRMMIRHDQPVRMGIAMLLSSARGKIFSLNEIVSYVYDDRSDGGPEFPERSIRVTILKMRQEGTPIRCETSRGYYMEAASD